MQTKIANDFGWHLLQPAKRFTERLFEALFLLVSIGLPLLAAWHGIWHSVSISRA